MTRPLSTAKQSVNLASGEVRVSKIRRDPPPVVKEIPVRGRDEVDRRMVAIGIITFALAIVVIIVGFGAYSGWSFRDYTVQV